MEFSVKKIGAIGQATLSLGKMTIVCGENNMGKTYMAYALYGFLDFWNNKFSLEIPYNKAEELLNTGKLEIDLSKFLTDYHSILERAEKEYTQFLPNVFAADEKRFHDSLFKISYPKAPKLDKKETSFSFSSNKSDAFLFKKELGSNILKVNYVLKETEFKFHPLIAQNILSDTIKKIVFDFKNVFIVSTERTGAALFKNDLNIRNNQLLREIASSSKDIQNPFDLLSKMENIYALPINENVDLVNRMDDFSNRESFISKTKKEILENLSEIAGGEYKSQKNSGVLFCVKNMKLKMRESSSSVRSLLIFDFYIRHLAKEGDLLIIDEPELNLHPKNQRKLARLLVDLTNCGISVFITTHSDYIVREISNIVMLSQGGEKLKSISKKYGYSENTKINAEDVKVYTAKKGKNLFPGELQQKTCRTLVPVSVSKEKGIESSAFDDEIDEMNQIYDAIIWG